MTDFFSRLDKYMTFKGLNDNKITVEAGISNGLIGKGRARGSISQDNISKILNTYIDLDANWLLTGKGAMLKQIQVGDNNTNINGNKNKIEQTNEELLDIIKEKDKQISKLLDIISK